MAFRTTPQLGPQLDQVVDDKNVWYEGLPQVGSPQVGVTVQGSDGHDYIWLKNNSGAQLTASARFNVSDDGNFTVAANGTGAWVAPAAAVPAGDFFWGKRFAL